MTRSVYVYGVVATGGKPGVQVDGVEGCPVRVVADGQLGALVSDLDSSSLAAARAVRAHWRVLEKAAERATVVPARFGTVLDDDQAVRTQLIAPNADELEGLLEALAGRIQLKVEGRYDEPRLLKSIVAASPKIAALQRRVRAKSAVAGYYDRIGLGEVIAAAVERRRAADTDRARSVLSPLAEANRIEEPRTPDTAFNLSFLVGRDREDAFGAGVAALRDELGDAITVRYIGPLPPYSFAEARLTPTEAR